MSEDPLYSLDSGGGGQDFVTISKPQPLSICRGTSPVHGGGGVF